MSITFNQLLKSADQTHVEQTRIFEELCKDHEMAEVVYAMEKWAKIGRLIYADKSTVRKELLGEAMQQFIKYTTQTLKDDTYMPFRNKEGKEIRINMCASYMGIRLSLVKEVFDAFLRHPEILVPSGALTTTMINKLNQIIPVNKRAEYIMCADSEGISERFFNVQVTAVNTEYCSGVKCMFSSIKRKDDEFYWIPKQYVGMKWVVADKVFIELLLLFIDKGFIDKDHYKDGVDYFKRNWHKIGIVKTEELKPYEDTIE